MNTITIANLEIPYRPEDQMYSLTEIWRQIAKDKNGEPDENKRPQQWLRLPTTQTYISALQKKLRHMGENPTCEHPPFYTTSRSKHIGTYANWMLTLAYCHYLKPELGVEIYGYFTRIKAGDVTLIDEIYHHATDEGKKWIERRVLGKVARRELTATLTAHGVVTGKGYAQCTNQIYLGLFDKEAKDLREDHAIQKDSQPTRDSLTEVDLQAIQFTETMASEKIKKRNIRGLTACSATCHNAGLVIKRAMQEFLAS